MKFKVRTRTYTYTSNPDWITTVEIGPGAWVVEAPDEGTAIEMVAHIHLQNRDSNFLVDPAEDADLAAFAEVIAQVKTHATPGMLSLAEFKSVGVIPQETPVDVADVVDVTSQLDGPPVGTLTLPSTSQGVAEVFNTIDRLTELAAQGDEKAKLELTEKTKGLRLKMSLVRFMQVQSDRENR